MSKVGQGRAEGNVGRNTARRAKETSMRCDFETDCGYVCGMTTRPASVKRAKVVARGSAEGSVKGMAAMRATPAPG